MLGFVEHVWFLVIFISMQILFPEWYFQAKSIFLKNVFAKYI